MNLNDLPVMSPLICLGATSVLVMLMVAIRRSYSVTFLLTLAALTAAFFALQWTVTTVPHRVTPLLIFDRYTLLYVSLLLAASAVSVLFSYDYLKRCQGNREEFYILILLATLGASVLAASNHFTSLFLGFELLSVSLYALIAYPHQTDHHIEAGVKYLLLAAVSSAFLLFGMALFYAASGVMALDRVSSMLHTVRLEDGDPWMLAGVGMMLVGIGFKLALVPFHLWTPDVYQGAPAPVTAFVATVSKGGVVALLMRLLPPGDIQVGSPLFVMFAVMSAASMLAGNLLALLQNNVKRILAYSSIAHLGYLLVAFLAGGTQAVRAVTFYLIAYFVTTLGAFGVITVLSSPEGEAEDLEDYRGLFQRRPWLAGIFTAMALSLAGLPLTAGFIGKFYLIVSGVEASLWALVIILVLSSTIGLYYYLRIIVALYSQGPKAQIQTRSLPLSLSGSLTLAILTLILIWLGTVPTPILHYIERIIG